MLFIIIYSFETSIIFNASGIFKNIAPVPRFGNFELFYLSNCAQEFFYILISLKNCEMQNSYRAFYNLEID